MRFCFREEGFFGWARTVKLCFILPYLKILVAFFLFESTLPTSPSPLKEHQMWLFLVHILFVCFFWFFSVPSL